MEKRLHEMIKVPQIDSNICFHYNKSEQMMWKRKIDSSITTNALFLKFFSENNSIGVWQAPEEAGNAYCH